MLRPSKVYWYTTHFDVCALWNPGLLCLSWLSPFLFCCVDVFLAVVDSWFVRLSDLILPWGWLVGCACLDLTDLWCLIRNIFCGLSLDLNWLLPISLLVWDILVHWYQLVPVRWDYPSLLQVELLAALCRYFCCYFCVEFVHLYPPCCCLRHDVCVYLYPLILGRCLTDLCAWFVSCSVKLDFCCLGCPNEAKFECWGD
jgi:hypothetical protein